MKVVYKGMLEPPVRQALIKGTPPGVTLAIIDRGATPEEEAAAIRDAEMLVVHKAWFGVPTAELLEQAEKLRLFQTLSQGVGHLPVQQLAARGVATCYAGGATGIGIAEYAVMLLLATIKRLRPAMAKVREGQRVDALDVFNIHRLHGQTVGIVGFGNSGRQVAKIMGGFGAYPIFYNRSVIAEDVAAEHGARQVGLDELLRQADVVTLHVPLTESTRGMIGEKQLAMMKPTAILVNIARGAVVDEAALIKALQAGRLAGAGLDVFAEEPVAPDNPLLHMENVVATPHIAAESREDYLALFELLWDNAVRLMKGRELRNPATPDTP